MHERRGTHVSLILRYQELSDRTVRLFCECRLQYCTQCARFFHLQFCRTEVGFRRVRHGWRVAWSARSRGAPRPGSAGREPACGMAPGVLSLVAKPLPLGFRPNSFCNYKVYAALGRSLYVIRRIHMSVSSREGALQEYKKDPTEQYWSEPCPSNSAAADSVRLTDAARKVQNKHPIHYLQTL